MVLKPGELSLPSIMYFVVFSSKTAFFRMKDIFPECSFYTEDSPQIEPLMCLQHENSCHKGRGCMENLARRLSTLFDEVCTEADLILLYFKKRNYEGLGAGVFDRDFEYPRVITMNPSAWEMVKRRGNIYQFDPTFDFFTPGSSAEAKKSELIEDQLIK